MRDRPYVLLSCSMSLDGYLDSATDERLLLSNDADFDRVDEVRSGCDAILVGATTVRNDNPRCWCARSGGGAGGWPPACRPRPLKVTLTAGGDLDPCARFFTRGDREKLVYCPTSTVATAGARLDTVATVVDGGPRGPAR